MKQGFVIPVYRHAKTACLIAQQLAAMGLPVIIIDDGNTKDEQLILEKFADNFAASNLAASSFAASGVQNTPGITLIRLEKNSGKGKAVIMGFKKADELGITHVLQIDADGQHDIERVKFFLEESEKNPDKIVCGYPEFDSSAPRSRLIGRKISTFWAAIVTLSAEIKDSHCGFRVYPVEASLKAARNIFFDNRMGFDSEILVRLYWKNILPVFHPLKVIYPQDGISNFNMVKDNIRISWMFTRLFIGMLLRIPILIPRKIIRSIKSE